MSACSYCKGTEAAMILVDNGIWMCLPCLNKYTICEDCGRIFKATWDTELCPRCQYKKERIDHVESI